MIHHRTKSATFGLAIVGFLVCIDNAFQKIDRRAHSRRILENMKSGGGMQMAFEMATFGAGRFWDTEAVFQHIRGVKQVQSGYAGGKIVQPSYEQVCSGDTGHAEVVQIQFDNAIVSYKGLMEVFFKIHDPCATSTADFIKSSPYRSIVMYHTPEQKRTTQELMKKMERFASAPVTTELLAYSSFFLAEQPHQNFYKNNKKDPYCQEFIVPKIMRSREVFARKKMAA